MEREEGHRVRLLYAEMVVKSSLSASRLAAGQTLYRSISNRLASAAGPINPGSGANGKPAKLVARCHAAAQVRGADRAIWRLSK